MVIFFLPCCPLRVHMYGLSKGGMQGDCPKFSPQCIAHFQKFQLLSYVFSCDLQLSALASMRLQKTSLLHDTQPWHRS